MVEIYRRPGGATRPDDFVTRRSNSTKPFPGMGPGARARLRGGAGIFRPSMGAGTIIQVDMIGARAVAEHAEAFEEMIGPLIWSIQEITGQYATVMARKFITEYDVIDSGDTLRSVYHYLTTSGAGIGEGSVTVDIGPSTWYAPFPEYGMGGHAGIGPRPFMMDTFFAVLPLWRTVFMELADLGKRGQASRSFQTEPYARTLNAQIGRVRQRLYSVEKEIGDVFPLGLPSAIGRHLRSYMVDIARTLGDIQAVVGRAVGARYSRRLSGRITGRLIGVGAHSIFGGASYTTSISGGQRVYNRIAGKYMARFASQNRLLSGHAFDNQR